MPFPIIFFIAFEIIMYILNDQWNDVVSSKPVSKKRKEQEFKATAQRCS